METHTGIRGTQEERGAALVIALALVIGVGALASGLLLEAMAERTSVSHLETSQLALDAAETGIVMAEQEIRGQWDPDGDGIGTITGTLGGGVYTITATQHGESAERWRLVAVGTHGLSTRQVEVGLRRRGRQRHVESLYSRETLEFGGSSSTDAYDSRLGPYADQVVSSDAAGSYARGGGHVGSGKHILLSGSSTTIRGNAVPGPLHSVDVSGGPVVWGDTLPRHRAVDVPPIPYSEFESAFLVNDNDSILGTNALGAETPQDVATLSDANLSALSSLEIEALKTYDTFMADDATLDTLAFDQLVAPTYASVLSVDASALALSSVTDVKAIEIKSVGELEQIDIVSLDGADGYYDADDGVSALPTASPIARPGRVSYNPDTYELRATAGAAVVLDGGTYFFSDIKLAGRAYVVVRGPSTIYVTGEVDLGGGAIINAGGRPADLRILPHPYPLPPNHPPDSCSVKIRGGAEVAAVVYGPEADVSIGGGGAIYGSIVGREIRVLGNVDFHYDLSLAEDGSGSGATLERLYWRDLTVSPR